MTQVLILDYHVIICAVPLFYDHKVQNRRWNHLDFQMGRRAGFFVNYRVLEALKLCESDNSSKAGS